VAAFVPAATRECTFIPLKTMRRKKTESELSFLEIQQQIEVLKQKAEAVRRKEVTDVIARIKEAIKHYGLTASDLGLAGAKAKPAAKPVGRRAAKKTKAAKAPAEAKFRDEAGNTWGGRGKRPQWLRDALAAGKTLADFAVK
jgi:DNA-binding protein H-NS